VPSLMAYLLNVTILYSTSRQHQLRELTDLYFSPPLQRVGLLQWSRFDQIVKQGYDHAVELLGGLSEAQRSALGMATSGAMSRPPLSDDRSAPALDVTASFP